MQAPSNKAQPLYQTLRPIYMEMWQFLIQEKRTTTHIKKLIHRCDLEQAADTDFLVNVHIIGNKCCPECDKYDQRTMPLSEALHEEPLPISTCVRANGCTCCYGFIGVRDENGRLVLIKR